MNDISTIAIDLAKSVFQICIVSGHNKVSKQLRLSREKFRQFMLEQTPSRVVMEACYSSHYWARLFQQQGHQVLLIPAQHVTPFVRGNKNDQNDALAIYEASMRPNIRFVPIKSLGQQDVQSLHRMRERLVKDRTALCNQMRGLLTDYAMLNSFFRS
jgi:transposase